MAAALICWRHHPDRVMQDFLITHRAARAAAEYQASYARWCGSVPGVKPYLGAMGGVQRGTFCPGADPTPATRAGSVFRGRAGHDPADLAAMRAACLE